VYGVSSEVASCEYAL